MLRSVVIVTGASKGFGSAVAKAFAKSCPGSIHFVLSARNQQELNETKCEILQIRHILNLETTCETVLGDITDSKQLERLAEGLFNSVTHKDDNSLPVSITFVNNAGSLGPLRPIGSPLTSFSEIATAVNLNVTGCLYLTSEFVRRFEQSSGRSNAVVVNVSSLAAVQSFPSWGVYCAGKAARDMYHTALADEQRNKLAKMQAVHGTTITRKEVLVLNYAPGPMDTKMQAEIRTLEQNDPTQGTMYTDMKAQNLLVDPLVSAEKMVAILNTPNSFRSGAHIDFYDDLSLS